MNICHICGRYAKLSFEHVPPQSAFNDKPLVTASIINLIQNHVNLDEIKGKIVQGGIGEYTLCESCNANTGSWYGPAFIEWSYQAMHVLILSKGNPSLYYLFRIFPLRVLKQIICMFFSVNSNELQSVEEHLVRFILNREGRLIDTKIRVFCFYNPSDRSRITGGAGIYNIYNHRLDIISEIIFPPMGYVITFDSIKPDNRLFDITFFADYQYNDWKEFSLKLPVLPIYTHLPGDYRNRKQVLDEIDK